MSTQTQTAIELRGGAIIASGGKNWPSRGPAALGWAMSRIEAQEAELQVLHEKLRQAQKTQAMLQFSGGVAHDFNNLLGIIRGYAEILLRQVTPDGAQAKPVREIMQATDRATKLTANLLAFSRRHGAQPKIVDMVAAVSEIEGTLRGIVGEDISLVVEAPDEVGSVRADPGQIEQTLMNLTANARDAMPRGGSLRITLRDADVTEQERSLPPGAYVLMEVRDTGCGMDEKTRGHLFEPFFTTKPEGQGTGLSLSTVHEIVRRSGGTILVDSQTGCGTTFSIYLPRVEGRHDRESVERIAHAGGSGQTLLLVEDEESLRLILLEVLANAGYLVLGARNGEEALERAQAHVGRIDLVIADVILPGLSGPEMVRHLLVQRPALKALYMSGYTADVMARRGGFHAGMTLLEKPFTPGALLAQVREAIGRSGAEARLN